MEESKQEQKDVKESEKKLTKEEEKEQEEIVEKRYKEAVEVKKPEGPKENIQDLYDANATKASDAIKNAPPSRASIDFTIKNQASEVEMIKHDVEAKEAAELAKDFPEDVRFKKEEISKINKKGEHINVTAEEAIAAESQNFKNTLPTYNGAETTDDMGVPIDRAVANADFHSKNSKGDTV